MAERPAKRPRRSTIIVSDDDDGTTVSNSSLPSRTRLNNDNTKLNGGAKKEADSRPQKLNTKSSTSKNSSANLKNSSSPQKSRKSTRLNLDSQNNKSLHTFFSRATEEQRWQRRADTPQEESQEDLIVDDIVDDDSLDDDLIVLSQGQVSSYAPTKLNRSVASSFGSIARSSTPVSSQRFARPAASTRIPEPVPSDVVESEPAENRPWADRFGPSDLGELAIHKKKIADVQKWIEDVNVGRSPQKLLVLKGPAGSGKSTTVSLIAKALELELLHWQNPVVSETGYTSSIQQFAEFLSRGGQFDALSFNSTTSVNHVPLKSNRQLLVVEEFPTSMTRSSNVLEIFRSILLQHIIHDSRGLQSGLSKTSSNSRPPLVLIISETLLTSSTALTDSFTAHRLLGAELLHHPLVSIIEFNPVAPTFISKAIDLVIKKEARESQRRRTPGSAVLQQLADVGDIRSAINSLEFICARGDSAADWSGTVAARSKKTSKANVSLTEVEKNTLQLISQRESTLDMFHATGKVVYNKREDPRVQDNRAEPPPKPPDHLMHLYSPKVSQVDVDALLNETGTDIQTFISTLHENYILSCNGDDFVDSFDGCAQHLSDSDFLNPESRSLIRAKGSSRPYSNNLQSGNYDMLRQDEISFQVASRGLLFSLPFPVNRAVPTGVRKQDAFKMFYPASLRLWKPAEEIYDLISMYSEKLSYENPSLPTPLTSLSGVASWKSRSLAFAPTVADFSEEAEISSRSPISRDDLVTQVLPYLTMICASQKKDVPALKKITQLRGINISGDELVDEEQYDKHTLPTASARLQQKVEEAHSMLQAQRTFQSAKGNTSEGQGRIIEKKDDLEKMYLSDDDIQDD